MAVSQSVTVNDLFGVEADEELEQGLPMELGDDDQPMHMLSQDDDAPPQTQEENEQAINMLRDLSKGAAKKKVMKPQPKLDADRLKGPKGIATLPKIFEKIKFLGKGHEGEDLITMMNTFENWAHRMMPKMTFDEVIERSENLGNKKHTQTIVKKMRLGMPILDEDFVTQDPDGGEAAREDEQFGGSDKENEDNMDQHINAEEAYEAMLAEERQKQKAIAADRQEDSQPQHSPLPPTSDSTQNDLSDEVQARIERNRQQAIARRNARLGIKPPTQPKPAPSAVSSSPPQLMETERLEDDQSIPDVIANTEDLHLHLPATEDNSDALQLQLPQRNSMSLSISEDSQPKLQLRENTSGTVDSMSDEEDDEQLHLVLSDSQESDTSLTKVPSHRDQTLECNGGSSHNKLPNTETLDTDRKGLAATNNGSEGTTVDMHSHVPHLQLSDSHNNTKSINAVHGTDSNALTAEPITESQLNLRLSDSEEISS